MADIVDAGTYNSSAEETRRLAVNMENLILNMIEKRDALFALRDIQSIADITAINDKVFGRIKTRLTTFLNSLP